MIPPDIITKFSGPPGTGKSTTLLNVVEQLLSSGVDPEHIVYTTFTRAGAYEARDRACARFNLTPQRLPYFRTLHSLCFGLLPSNEVMQPSDWGVVAGALGLFFSHYMIREEGILAQGETKGDYLMALWSYMRVTRMSLQETYDRRNTNGLGYSISIQEFEHFIRTAEAYKKEFCKMDYTDMLERWLSEGNHIHADYVIIDEAQDLSALQWYVVEKLCMHAKQIWIAGDDDQAIHEWSGALPQNFIRLDAKNYTVLPQSYRIPKSVHGLAESVIQRVHERLPKTYHPRTEEGAVCRVSNVDDLDLSKGEWLLLARNNHYLKEYAELCRRRGLLYTINDNASMDNIYKFISAVRAWKELQIGKTVVASEVKNLYVFMSQRDRVKRGFKTPFYSVKDDLALDYKTLVEQHGLVAPSGMPWEEAIDMIPDDIRFYMRAIERSSGFDSKPRIRISSIHNSKGKEADHVAIMPEMTPLTRQGFCRYPDAEHRTFYVGVTRARQSLHLLPALSERAYPI